MDAGIIAKSADGDACSHNHFKGESVSVANNQPPARNPNPFCMRPTGRQNCYRLEVQSSASPQVPPKCPHCPSEGFTPCLLTSTYHSRFMRCAKGIFAKGILGCTWFSLLRWEKGLRLTLLRWGKGSETPSFPRSEHEERGSLRPFSPSQEGQSQTLFPTGKGETSYIPLAKIPLAQHIKDELSRPDLVLLSKKQRLLFMLHCSSAITIRSRSKGGVGVRCQPTGHKRIPTNTPITTANIPKWTFWKLSDTG